MSKSPIFSTLQKMSAIFLTP